MVAFYRSQCARRSAVNFFFYLALCSEGLMFEYKSDGGGAQFFYCIYQSLCAGVGAAR